MKYKYISDIFDLLFPHTPYWFLILTLLKMNPCKLLYKYYNIFIDGSPGLEVYYRVVV